MEVTVQKSALVIGFMFSFKLQTSPQDLAVAFAGTVVGYLEPECPDSMAVRWQLSADVRAKRSDNRRCLYCGWLNYIAVECTDRKKAQIFKAAGAELKGGQMGEAFRCCTMSTVLNLSVDPNSLSLIDMYTRTKVHVASPHTIRNKPMWWLHSNPSPHSSRAVSQP